MPFKVTFRIYEPGKEAPCMTTSDPRLAHAEYKDRCNKMGCAMTRMTTEVKYENLTKSEQYVYLVYRVRKAIKRYFGCGRKKEDKDASFILEGELDKWNAITRAYLNNHPNWKPTDEKAHSFFLLVEKWREVWHKYFAYKVRKDKDLQVENEMKKQCFALEGEIDKYIREVIGL